MSSRRGWLRRGARQIEHVFALIGVLFVTFRLLLELSVVVSSSMSPTLQGASYENGDWLLTERISYRLRSPRRWEVVTYRAADGELVSKRVLGLPGETIALSNAKPVINGSELEIPASLSFLRYYPFGNLREGRERRIDDGYYVMGDDSKDSQDSRFEGEVEPRGVVGRAIFILWPPERVGFVR